MEQEITLVHIRLCEEGLIVSETYDVSLCLFEGPVLVTLSGCQLCEIKTIAAYSVHVTFKALLLEKEQRRLVIFE